MMKYYFFLALLLLIGCNQSEQNKTHNESKKPNILLILADDMGYSDLGCYGGEINTPNLDQMANEGLRFTQFYNGARCCPTRASLLTGISPHLAGMGGMVRPSIAENENAYQGYLSNRSVTLAEVLKPVGYRTYMTGKWHVGEFRPVFPVDRGFDRYYGLISGAMNYWNIEKGKRKNIHRTFAEDTTVINDQINNGFYSTHAYTDKAIDYLDDHFTNYNQQPFFMYIAHQAPHWPLHAPDSAIAKYRGKYKGGWNKMREDRYQRMLEMGLIDPNHRLSPLDDDTSDWDTLSESQKDSMDLKMAIYAAMVDLMDANIGRVMDKLAAQGELDNTLILFLSDNGASYEHGSLGLNFRPDLDGEMGGEDSYYSYGSSWANASNTPFKKFKRYTYEGGFATPLIARWGDQIKDRNKKTNAVGHITDIMATIVDIAGAAYPHEVGSRQIHPMEGKSLLPIFTNSQENIRTDEDVLIWEHEGNKAVRKGDWKLVKQREDKEWKLYDLAKDRTEINDLALEFPELVNTLSDAYISWAEKVGVKEKGPDDQ